MKTHFSPRNNIHDLKSRKSKIPFYDKKQSYNLDQNESILQELISLYQQNPRDNFFIKARFPKLEIVHQKCLQTLHQNQNNYFSRRNSEPFRDANNSRSYKEISGRRINKKNHDRSCTQQLEYSSCSSQGKISLFSEILMKQQRSKQDLYLENTGFQNEGQSSIFRKKFNKPTQDFQWRAEFESENYRSIENGLNIHEYSFSHEKNQQSERKSNSIQKNCQKGQESQIFKGKQTSSFSLNSSFGDLIGINPNNHQQRFQKSQQKFKGQTFQDNYKQFLQEIEQDDKQSQYSSKKGSKISNQSQIARKDIFIDINLESFKKSLSLTIKDQNKRDELIQLAKESQFTSEKQQTGAQTITKTQENQNLNQNSKSPKKIISKHFCEHLRTLNDCAKGQQQIFMRKKCSKTIRVVHQEVLCQSVQSLFGTQILKNSTANKDKTDEDCQFIRKMECLNVLNPENEQSY